MHGPHDVGGRDGLGPVATEFLEPGIPDWRYPFEGRMHAVTAMALQQVCSTSTNNGTESS